MTSKMPKPAYQIVLGALILTFAMTAYNNKGGDKKATPPDSSAVKPADKMQPVDSTSGDSLKHKPTAPGD